MHSEKLSELSQRFTLSLLLATAEQICQSVTGPPHAGTLLQGSASVKIEPCLGLLLWNLAHNVVGYVTQHYFYSVHISTPASTQFPTPTLDWGNPTFENI